MGACRPLTTKKNAPCEAFFFCTKRLFCCADLFGFLDDDQSSRMHVVDIAVDHNGGGGVRRRRTSRTRFSSIVPLIGIKSM